MRFLVVLTILAALATPAPVVSGTQDPEVEFRRAFGLDTSAAAVTLALAGPIDARFGVHLTSAESAELDARAARQPEIANFRAVLEARLPDLGGLYIDHPSAGLAPVR